MSLLDKLIHELDEQNSGVEFHKSEFEDIKDNIKTLLNTKLDDCFTMRDLGMQSISQLSIGSNDLCVVMIKEIQRLISKYEQRIQISSITYDNALSPWQLSFILRCYFQKDHFKEFNIEIIFKNNRYCEVI